MTSTGLIIVAAILTPFMILVNIVEWTMDHVEPPF